MRRRQRCCEVPSAWQVSADRRTTESGSGGGSWPVTGRAMGPVGGRRHGRPVPFRLGGGSAAGRGPCCWSSPSTLLDASTSKVSSPRAESRHSGRRGVEGDRGRDREGERGEEPEGADRGQGSGGRFLLLSVSDEREDRAEEGDREDTEEEGEKESEEQEVDID